MKLLVLVLGIILFVVGLVFLFHPSFNYHKHEEVAKIGPITATVDRQETAQVPVAVTATLLVAGLLLVVVGARSKS